MERGRKPPDAEGEDVVAPDAGVGDALAVLVGDDEAREDRLLHRHVRRVAAGRGRRVPGYNRLFRLHRAGDGDLIDLAVGIGDGDFCARTQLVLDVVEVKLIAALREGLAVGTAGLGGQLEAARQIDVAAVDAVTDVAPAAVTAVAASDVDRTAGDGDIEAADAVAAGEVAASAIGRDGTAGDGGTGAGDAVAAGAITARAIASGGSDRTAGNGEAAAAGDAVAAVGVAVTTGEMVFALQGQRHVAVRSESGAGVGLDVHIVQRDLDLIVPGVDGHGVGRSGGLVTICDDGVGVIFGGHIVLGDVVAALTRRNRNVAILNIVGICKGGEGRPGQQGSGQDKRRCPLRGRTG